MDFSRCVGLCGGDNRGDKEMGRVYREGIACDRENEMAFASAVMWTDVG
jgi:hypothetical protein